MASLRDQVYKSAEESARVIREHLAERARIANEGGNPDSVRLPPQDWPWEAPHDKRQRNVR